MKRIFILSIVLIGSVLAAADYTVTGDGAAIQKAIDAASAAGGGRVVVTPGVHKSGTLVLRSHVDLHLAEGAVIQGGTRVEDYTDFPRSVCAVSPESSYKVFLQAWDAEDIAVTGKGVIDGQGPAFYPVKSARGHWPKPKTKRPIMVQFVRCRGVRLEGVTFKDSPCWTMFIRLCENIAVDGITVVGDQRMINNDGIDFDSCKHVRVGNSNFKTGDDCLILRAMRELPEEKVVCEDVVVSNCVLNSTCQTIRMGCSSDDVIRNARFLNIKGTGNNGIFFDYPARYLRPYDEGYMDISDIVFDGYEGTLYGSALQIVAEPGVKIRGVRDVTFRNVKVKSRRSLRFIGNADSILTNITLENVTAEISEGKTYLAAATEPLRFKNCTFNGEKLPDGDKVTPRGTRQPLVRRAGGSWETLRQVK
ncbi:MAG: glycosyl hydrolase family 28 protein [Kiritimatiellae bacterium]|nr:glycosyl hydrolase family 28 protein [Kiritimatiellia bacterium]